MEQLAINGGKPIREKYLPYARHWVDQEEIQAVTEVLKSDYITSGPKIEEYEKAMAKYLGCQRVIATSSCTGAMHICLAALGVKSNDEVILPDLTFAATPSVSSMLGAQPVPVDIHPDTYNIDPEEIKRHITPRTKVIMPVHYAGQPCEMDRIAQLAKEHHLEVIEDAAHAISAEYNNLKIGNHSKASCFSFHPIKNMTMGEGGIIATNDEAFADKCKLLRLHGLDKYRMVTLGYKYTINEIQAALGLSQLQKLDFFEARRAKYAQMYLEGFKDLPEIILPKVLPQAKSSWHLFVIRLNLDLLTIDRDKFREILAAENIGTQIHFVPIHHQPYYQPQLQGRSFPQTERVYQSMLTLPLFPKMEEQDVLDVIAGIKKVIQHYQKHG